MNETILTGQGREITAIPRADWERGLSAVPQHFAAQLEFMSEEHHLARICVVKELPYPGLFINRPDDRAGV